MTANAIFSLEHEQRTKHVQVSATLPRPWLAVGVGNVQVQQWMRYKLNVEVISAAGLDELWRQINALDVKYRWRVKLNGWNQQHVVLTTDRQTDQRHVTSVHSTLTSIHRTASPTFTSSLTSTWRSAGIICIINIHLWFYTRTVCVF